MSKSKPSENKKKVEVSFDLALDVLVFLSRFNHDPDECPSDTGNVGYELKGKLREELKQQ